MNRFAKFMRDYSVTAFLIPLSIVLIVFGVFYIGFYNKTKNYPTTEAVVTKTVLYEEEYNDGDTYHDATYTVYIEYTVDGKTYNEEYGVFSGMKKGDKVSVSYNPKKPSEVSQPASKIWLIGFFVLGIVALIGGILSFIKSFKKNKKLKLQEEEWKYEQ